MDLVRDLLDKLLLDRNRHEIGRVDGIVLEARDGAPPRVAGLEVGLGVVGRRLGRVPGRLAESVEHAIGLGGARPLRIPFSAVRDIDLDIRVDVAGDETPASLVERGLRAWLGGTKSGQSPLSYAWVATSDPRELRVEYLVGRHVSSANGRAVGRLEEIRAVRHGTGCTVTEYLIGSAGMLERLGLGARLVLGRKIGGGLVAEWNQLDPSAPRGPALTCAAADLRRE